MKLTLLGTGCPQVDLNRYGPANLVRAGGQSFLVDCGSGVTQRLLGAGSTGAQLDAVLLTLLVIQAFGAAVVGRLHSIPLANAGAYGIAIAATVATKFASGMGVR